MEARITNFTSDEQYVFRVIRDVVRIYAPHARVCAAGGWVRDKLLGLPSHDLDVVVEGMSGEAFAQLLAQYLRVKGPHIIEENPEASKHITTAKMYLPVPSGETMEIDFAQARQEAYAGDSRIPSEVKPATLEEDASRRDLTINAIFYDILHDRVRDFTGQGLDDLQTHVLRSPGNPYERFKQDPLRILRVLRFASRFGWSVEEKTFESMKSPDLLKELREKVSKERIGAEFAGMMKGKYPDKALEMMQQLGILQQLIDDAVKGTTYEGKLAPLGMGQNNPHHQLTLFDHTVSVLRNYLDQYPEDLPEKRLVKALAALGHDFGKMFRDIQQTKEDGRTSYHEHEDHSPKILELFLKHIKLHPLVPASAAIARFHMRPYQMLGAGKKALRRFLRDMAEHGVEWVDIINHSIADVMAKGELNESARADLAELNSLKETIRSLETEMETMGKPTNECILNGVEIMQGFNRKTPGKWVGDVKTWLLDQQDENPAITKEQAIEMARQHFPQHVIDMGPNVKSASIASAVLFKQKAEQIEGLLRTKRNLEAFSISEQLSKEYPDDENAFLLMCKTIVAAYVSDGKSRLTIETHKKIEEMADERFFNPMILCLSALLEPVKTGKKAITASGEQKLKRAFKLDKGITREMITQAISLVGDQSAKRILINGPVRNTSITA